MMQVPKFSGPTDVNTAPPAYSLQQTTMEPLSFPPTPPPPPSGNLESNIYDDSDSESKHSFYKEEGKEHLVSLILGSIVMGIGWGILNSDTVCNADMHKFVQVVTLYDSIVTGINAILTILFIASYIEPHLVNLFILASGTTTILWGVLTGLNLFPTIAIIGFSSIFISQDQCPGTNYRKWTLAMLILSCISVTACIITFKSKLQKLRTIWALVKK